MFRRIKIVLGFVCCVVVSGIAQTKQFDSDYLPLLSNGKLPKIYTTTATEKANKDIATVKKERNSTAKKAKENFYLISNFQMDQILRSGKIMFNDSLSLFVNKVADEAFREVPEVRKGLQIFVMKSDIVNAFTADNGIIIVTVGLLAQLDNEAQLAYILCHEASHFTKKHSVDSYVVMNSGKSSYKRNSLDKYKYSQDAEFEADSEGLKVFKKTKYSYKGISGAFNMLKYSYLPFDEIKFEKKFFEDSNLVFPASYFLTELNPIKVDENYDDSKSTHPNIKKRKDNVSRELGEFSDDGRDKFLVNKDQFYTMREMARFELCNIDLQQEDYADCIYESYVLLKKYPNNLYLKKMIGKALFNVAASKAPKEKEYKPCIEPTIDIAGDSYIAYDYSSAEGNLQQVYHLLNKLSASESNILALHYNWKLKDQFKSDKQLNQLCDSLFVLLALNNETTAAYFNKTSRTEYIREMTPVVIDTLNTDSTVIVKQDTIRKKLRSLDDLDDDDIDSKITRIGEQQGTVEIKGNKVVNTDSINYARLENEFDKYSLTELLRLKEFAEQFGKAEERNKDYRNGKFNDIVLKYKPIENKGGIGIDKIIILDPFYIKTDERNRDNYKYYDSEEKLLEYAGVLQENAKIAGLESVFIDSHTLNTNDIETYNDYTLLNDWMSEFMEHGYNRNMMILGNEAAEKMQKKYNTRYVLWSGVYNNRTEKKNIGMAVALTVFSGGLFAPFTIPYIFRKEQQTLYFSVVYDLEYNEILYSNTSVVRLSDSKDFLNAFVYDTMLTIKSKPKQK
ncbi:MAG: M48 family metallopeptidase [Bacteroidota bacterium]|nr:M48 family metallopeptidase [Bacteroidota bacterium]